MPEPDTTPAAKPSGFTWAQSVASHGAGPTATIDIDIHAPGHQEPVPVEIGLADARTLHHMLGGVLAEHDETAGCPHIREGGCCNGPGYCCHACEPAPGGHDGEGQ